jgi:2-iminobutanoate/2-iminopropanoate deaminase
MSEKTVIRTDKAPAAVGPYAQGVRLADLVFCSGQLPIDPSTSSVPDGVEAQTRQSLDNVAAVLAAGGASMNSVVKTTVFLKDMNDFAKMNAIYATYFENDAPARSTIEVARLPRDVLVEVEAIAAVVKS